MINSIDTTEDTSCKDSEEKTVQFCSGSAFAADWHWTRLFLFIRTSTFPQFHSVINSMYPQGVRCVKLWFVFSFCTLHNPLNYGMSHEIFASHCSCLIFISTIILDALKAAACVSSNISDPSFVAICVFIYLSSCLCWNKFILNTCCHFCNFIHRKFTARFAVGRWTTWNLESWFLISD